MILINKELLLKSYTIKVLFLIFFKIISSILDILAIILTLDYVKAILDLDKKNLVSNLFLNKIFSIEFIFSSNKFIDITITLIFFFFIKFLFQIFLVFLGERLVEEISRKVSTNLFEKFLTLNYNFFLEQNTSKLVATLITETKKIRDYVISILDSIQHFFFIIGIAIFFIFTENIKFFLFLAFFVFFFIVIFIATKKYLVKVSDELITFNEEIQKIFYQIFNSINEIKILKLENFFNKKTFFYVSSLNRKISNRNLIFNAPKFFFEFAFILLILSSASYLIFFQENILNKNISDLFVIFISALRLYPAFNSLAASLMSYKTNRQTIIKLNNFCSSKINSRYLQFKSSANSKFNYKKPFLRFINVDFKYNNSSKFIFKKLNITIRKGEKIGITGESGAGKTTFINLVFGLLNPTKGVVLNYGLNIKYNLDKWHNFIGYVPQNVFLFDDTIKNNIALGIDKNKINKMQIKDLLKFLKLDSLIKINNSNLEIGERGKRISGGQGQRIGLGRALYRKPQFLILDEATNSLDNKIEKKILNKIFKLKEKTIILITHKKELLRYCDRVINLNRILNSKI
jgi:ABC-type multidrug transport system fused ATPase/permease subunit